MRRPKPLPLLDAEGEAGRSGHCEAHVEQISSWIRPDFEAVLERILHRHYVDGQALAGGILAATVGDCQANLISSVGRVGVAGILLRTRSTITKRP